MRLSPSGSLEWAFGLGGLESVVHAHTSSACARPAGAEFPRRVVGIVVGGLVEEAGFIYGVTRDEEEEDGAEWRLRKKTHQEREAEEQTKMIQNLNADFDCI